MKLLALLMLRALDSDPEALILHGSYELGDFNYFQRGRVKEFVNFFAKTLAKRVPAGQRSSVEHEEYICHVHSRANRVVAVALCDREYPPRVAFTFLMKAHEAFAARVPDETWLATTRAAAEAAAEGGPCHVAELDGELVRYRDPATADSIMKMQNDLDETKIILHKTIDSVLERGVKLDQLVEKSNDLSVSSKMFYQTAQDQNSCCSMM